MLVRLTALLASGLLAGCSMVGVRSGYEAPAYEVVDAHKFIWSVLGTDFEFGYDGSYTAAAHGLVHERGVHAAFFP